MKIFTGTCLNILWKTKLLSWVPVGKEVGDGMWKENLL